ncbi:MAG: sugar ABC transporter ATP-binding protein [Treponema sp.]|nr:sugar ABC transporter ATP-binding protein [Treponema sp.]
MKSLAAVDQAKQIILEGKHLGKQFYGNVVLQDVSIQCRRHNILALVGENGAGKTTLMNIISGGLQPDNGTISLDGRTVVLKNSHAARALGISFVHQELSLFEMLTVGENIMMGFEPGKYGIIDEKALHQKARETLAALDYDIGVGRMVEDLSPAEKQIVEIAKAWITGPRILILDEPTSSLNKVESDKLFRFVRRARDTGVSVILITHRIDEIFEVCDEANVLRDGIMTAQEPVENLTKDLLIGKMVGREVTNAFPPRCKVLSSEVVLELKEACTENLLRHINLEVPRGSVVGIGGLEGQGQRQLVRALFGIVPFAGGEYTIKGHRARIKNPSQAMRSGLAFVPDDRKTEGLALPLSVQENMTLLVLRHLGRVGIVNEKQVRQSAEGASRSLNIKFGSFHEPVLNLSGGNQQKVVFSKWIQAAPEILLLHEPTRGVDVQSKLEIYALIRSLTGRGISVILVTSDMLELIGMSDTIYIMYEGRITGRIAGTAATEEKLMTLSSGLALERG